MLQYPGIDPIAFSVGPLHVRWYGITYLIGFGAAWALARWRAARPGSTWKPIDVDDVVFFAMLGVIFGGRIGYVLFYGMSYWLADPLYPFKIWDGGMSFHGGLLGVLIAIGIFAVRRGRSIVDVFDFMAPLPGVGLCSGRIGNFINGELWGKPTEAAWAFVVQPGKLQPSQTAEALQMCRRFGIDPCVLHVHASQLYEAFLEGVVLFALLWWFTSKPRPRLAPAGLFLLLYGIARCLVEFVRVPDAQIGYLAGYWLTMGQMLSLPMIVIGGTMLVIAYQRRVPSGNLAPAR
jgi:phosphatidylglycerol:prolipoprotein diacylglycerol transferase